MTKPVILTGLRANNDLTLGNYFGGMLPIIDMAKQRSSEFQINMFIPDLHSFTTPIDHTNLYAQILQTAKVFTAAGLPLDNDSIHLYRQSYVPAHSELTWILDNFARFGEMRRMTQFKEKSNASKIVKAFNNYEKNLFKNRWGEARLQLFEKMNSAKVDQSQAIAQLHNLDLEIIEELLTKIYEYITQSENLDASVGIFNYPVLMASDILLYSAKYVPVGDDQTQHLEFTRDIAERMNTRFGEILVVPEPVKKQHEFFAKKEGLRIKDLQDPTKKMSKSDASGKGVIFLSDSPEIATKKIMSAATDDKASVRYDTKNQPGISNLLEILALLRGTSIENIAKEFENETHYGEFKKVVAGEVAEFLEDFQSKLETIDESVVLKKLESSEAAMNIQANETLFRVQQAVGLRPKGN